MVQNGTDISADDSAESRPILGWLSRGTRSHPLDDPAAEAILKRVEQAAWVLDRQGEPELARADAEKPLLEESGTDRLSIRGYVPALPPERLGDPSFRRDHHLRFAYYAGAMANGIASVDLVEAVCREGMLAFFGSAGLTPAEVESAIESLKDRLGDCTFGFNLINSIHEPKLEAGLVDLYIRSHIHLIEAAAYMDLTLPLVRYRVHGIHCDASGRIQTPNRIVAKVSREEVAAKFFSPPPEALLAKLVASGQITREQAALAAKIPMAQDVTAEADSGGHTDNRPAVTLFPTLKALRDRMQAEYGFQQTLRLGLAGGISTPLAATAAFAMGAAYIVTGTVNQACIESGTSDTVRTMLAEARQADMAMAPAADMFEMGVTVQVLKRGTMFSMRAAKLYELYQKYGSIDEIQADERARLEKTIFRSSLEESWNETRKFFMERDPEQVERAERDPRHKMALIFRAYLGLSSHWAHRGEASRKVDYQIWCGPAMGAFNEWVRGSSMEEPSNRKVADVAHCILYGAAVLMRSQILRSQGVELPPALSEITPQQIKQYRSNQVDPVR
ncbi:MAG: PfaD family polyunsaturated fatty acid/polyketide biosynthesis protein [Planctomycetota bacterium]